MSKCKKCERELLAGEEGYCPACSSDNAHNTKVTMVLLTFTSVLVGTILRFIAKR